jgi:predicted permease
VGADLVRGAVAERLGLSAGPSDGTMEWTKRTDREGMTMRGLMRDLGDAWRRVVRSPFFSAAAVLIVALGIGANTAVFTLVDAMLLRPPPFADADRVVRIYQDSDDGEPGSTSFPAYRDMAAFVDVFSAVSARTPATVTWEAPEGPRNVTVEFATASHMDVVGREPALGRWFEPAHDHPGAGYFGVVSHRTWRNAMAGDPGVVGSTVRMNGRPVTIIGVGPEGFNGGEGPLVSDFWLSISSVEVGGSFRVANLDRREDHWYDVMARLAPGVTVEQASAAMGGLASRLAADWPELNSGRDITVFRSDEVRIHPEVDGRMVPVAAVLLGLVAAVLLLACSNLANLLLVRGMVRESEVAVRRALGASRLRVARLFLAEALLLSLAGGVLGVLLARWSLGFADRLAVFLPIGAGVQLTMDGGVLLFTLGLVLASTVFFGLAPAVRSARQDPAAGMREGPRSATTGRATSLVQGGLVAVQVAASVVLLVGAGLLARSLVRVQSVDPGFRVEGLAYLSTNTNVPGLAEDEKSGILERLREGVAALPGTEAAAVTSRLPLGFGGSTTTVVEGYEPPSGTGAVELDYALVGEGYFDVLDVPVVEGRAFGPDDGPGGERVVLVNETAARRFWGGVDPIGRRLRPQSAPDGWRTVIGVVGDHSVERLDERPTPMIYFPAGRTGLTAGYVVARTTGLASTLLAPMRAELGRVDPTLPLSRLGTMGDQMGEALLVPRLTAALLGAFALLAVLLASVGVYAVVSFSVARRTAEMGIRVALGAERGRLVRRVVLRTLGTVALGVAAGLGVALAGAPLLGGLLYGVPALDPASFAAAALVLTVLAAVAAWVPARRAAEADPVEALRSI